MHDIADLVGGYQRFYATRGSKDAPLYRKLSEEGQTPKTMVISCCDSRVDPSAIFDAGPGELFVVRNVANLVPPFEPAGDYHGTSAALEFAVTGLEVENIVVMGHARCGGVQAFLEGNYEETKSSTFIYQWMSLLKTARDNVLASGPEEAGDERQRLLELDSVRCSLDNLKTFPFIQDAIANNVLKLRGAYFSIFHGSLLGMDAESGEFEPVAM